jgi:uncharacterized protein (DUF58 family)
MRYQGPGAALSKLEYAKCLAATLAHVVLRQQDSVGLVTFDSQIRSFVRAASNPSHIKQLLHVLEQSSAERKTQSGALFHDLAERLKKRGIVIVIGDLFDDVAAIVKGFEHLRHRRHEVIVLHVLDPAELEFPFHDTTRFRGLEQWPSVVAEPQALRRAYLEHFQEYLRQLERGCRRHRIDYVLARTDRPVDLVLSSYLASRMRK